ncbi:MAG: hypothetical protein ACTHZH_15280, partial [Oleiphilaceae bacterium]
MLFSKLQTLTSTVAALSLLMLARPTIVQAAPPAEKEKATLARELLLAELAEDESVEVVERSEPRRQTDKAPAPSVDSGPEESAPEKNAEKPKPALKPIKVAPNIDLKEVAPAPTPEPAKKPDSKEQKVPEPEPTPEPDSKEPQPANNLVLLGSEVLPGTSTRLAWSPGIQIAGLAQPTPVL